MTESKWLNNTMVRHPELEKPCDELRYCPYGQLIEEYPFSDNELSCELFGHDCPAHYLAETEDDLLNTKMDVVCRDCHVKTA